MTATLDAATAERFARIALGHVTREYPHKLDHVLNGPQDALPPSVLHPIFFGSFDWHSCVHGYWMLLRLLRRFPEMPAAPDIAALADRMLEPGKIAAERVYLERPGTAGFERPYGWAWLLALHGEAARHDAGWSAALAPLATAFADRFRTFLPKLSYPIRTGTHFNTAFAMILALEWAGAHDPALAALIRARAADWFGGDRDCQAWEPGGDEFLSPALIESLCMARVLGDGFPGWFTSFLPRLAAGEPATLLAPAFVSDRTDGKIAHLDGCNLSRAWCWRSIAPHLPTAQATIARTAADRHLAASLPHVAGDYMGEHWLATFATLALEA